MRKKSFGGAEVAGLVIPFYSFIVQTLRRTLAMVTE